MDKLEEGAVVICGSGQAGTLIQLTTSNFWVLLRNGDIWVGSPHQVRFPQDAADLEACPIDVEHLEAKRSVRSDY